jgi:FKBP-type peptidyl-prolyl cis-trans isomerase FkpA
MKKFFITLAIVATSLATMACNSEKSAENGEKTVTVESIDLKDYAVAKGAEIDTLSYAVGANLGLQKRFALADFEIDNDLYIKHIIEFYENGSLEDERLGEDQQKLVEFHYTRYMPYLQAQRQRESFATDRPDTLPIPEIYNENFTKESVTAMLGRTSGAMLVDMKDFVDIKWVVAAYNDGIGVESEDSIDNDLKLTTAQMNDAYIKYQTTRQKYEMEKHQRTMAENAEASAAWLAEVEQKEGVMKTESGLLYRIDREGSDVKATEDTDVVEVNYEGKTRTGKIFDSSYERGESISFGLNRVIRGWTEGMKLVGEGGQITLWIPAELAYGERGAGADIGPNEALEFKVELIKVNPEN